MSTSIARKWQLGLASVAAVGGLAFGFALHDVVLYVRDYGPSVGSWSLRGNGAITLVLIGALIVLAAEIALARHRAWLSALLLPVTTFLGLFVLLGTV